MSDLDLELPATAQAPARAREAMSQLDGIPGGTMEDLVLLVSEVVSNAVRHGSLDGKPINISAIIEPDQVRVYVSDGGPGLHMVPDDVPETPEGYGLKLLDALADEWGWSREPTSQVWFLLSWR